MALDPNTVELVRRFMLNTRIAALSSSQEVICVKDTATVEQAMKVCRLSSGVVFLRC